MKSIHYKSALLMAAFALAACQPKTVIESGGSASERTLAQDATLKPKRDPVMQQALTLAGDKHAAQALDRMENYLNQYPGDIVAGNLYRRLAKEANLYDRPIRFFVGRAKALTPCPDEPPECPDTEPDCAKKIMERCTVGAPPSGPPAGLRYNLAFGYIDKIPVVGPMGAGFLSKRSIEQFRLALKRDPDDWIANYGIGMNYLHWPDYFEKNDTSIGYFEHAIELQEQREIRPSDILAYVRLGDALAKAGEVDRARTAWERGKVRLGAHADLEERLQIDPLKLKEKVTQAYNPNNSIGTIDTDISILWSDQIPEHVLSLRDPDASTTVGGVGGQTLPERSGYEDVRLFNWFRDNLPLLMNRNNVDKVDMSGIGATGGEGAGIIAHNMILGFMTQFRGDRDADVVTTLTKAPDYDRPFFQEGIGMGLAAALDTSADGSPAPFAERINAFGPRYDRLHYAGLGMWYGLAPTVNMVRVRDKLGELPLRGQFYAYEGLGFAVALFKNAEERSAPRLLARLPFASASTFAHGAGRALWIKYGDDAAALNKVVEGFPKQFRPDLRAGYGMGVAFTRIHRLDEIGKHAVQFRDRSPEACKDYLTGATMGLAIRYRTDPGYVRKSMKDTKSTDSALLAASLLQSGLNALDTVQQLGAEMHRNWRSAIRKQLTDDQAAKVVKQTCEVTTR